MLSPPAISLVSKEVKEVKSVPEPNGLPTQQELIPDS